MQALHSSQLTGPAQLLLGIAESGGHVQMLFAYRDQFGGQAYDSDMTLTFVLPVREND